MGHYESDYIDASADLNEYYGQSISYADDLLNETQTFDASIHPERAVRRENATGWYWAQVRDVIFPTPDFELQSDGVFTVDNQQYSIESIDLVPGDRTQVSITRASAGEIGRPNYRR